MGIRFAGLAAVVLCCIACGPREDGDGNKGPIDGFIAGQPAADITQSTQSYALHPRAVIGTNSLTVMSAYSAYVMDPSITCPVVEDLSDGTVTDVTFTGGCTDLDGVRWIGVGHFYQDQTMLEMDGEGFGYSEPEDCGGVPAERTIISQGIETITTDEIGATWDGSYRIDITGPYAANCADLTQTIAVSMGGTISGLFMFSIGDEVVYDTDGQIAVSTVGRWAITAKGLSHPTQDQTTDGSGNLCYEPVGGTLQLKAGGNVADLHPDGATDCTPEACLTYSLNGDPQPSPICGMYGH